MRAATITKTKEAEPLGEYTPTGLDARKQSVDFLVKQLGPTVIAWRSGGMEVVGARRLAALKLAHSWECDF